jgi:hypothetical protein
LLGVQGFDAEWQPVVTVVLFVFSLPSIELIIGVRLPIQSLAIRLGLA